MRGGSVNLVVSSGHYDYQDRNQQISEDALTLHTTSQITNTNYNNNINTTNKNSTKTTKTTGTEKQQNNRTAYNSSANFNFEEETAAVSCCF